MSVSVGLWPGTPRNLPGELSETSGIWSPKNPNGIFTVHYYIMGVDLPIIAIAC